MSAPILKNYALGKWVEGDGGLKDIASAITGETVARTSSAGLDFKAMANYARDVGGPALRKLTFHDRAYIIKDLAKAIMEHPQRPFRRHPQRWLGRH